jgi:hypothetical protein
MTVSSDGFGDATYSARRAEAPRPCDPRIGVPLTYMLFGCNYSPFRVYTGCMAAIETMRNGPQHGGRPSTKIRWINRLFTFPQSCLE